MPPDQPVREGTITAACPPNKAHTPGVKKILQIRGLETPSVGRCGSSDRTVGITRLGKLRALAIRRRWFAAAISEQADRLSASAPIDRRSIVATAILR